MKPYPSDSFMHSHPILISEVGPRDGLQSVEAIMPTAMKLRWIAALAAGTQKWLFRECNQVERWALVVCGLLPLLLAVVLRSLERSGDGNHVSTVDLLRQVDTGLATALKRALDRKTQAGYESVDVSAAEATSCVRWARQLLAAAELVIGGSAGIAAHGLARLDRPAESRLEQRQQPRLPHPGRDPGRCTAGA